MTKPSNNNPSVGNEPESNDETVEVPADDAVVEVFSYRRLTNEQEIVRLQLQLTDERKNRERNVLYVQRLLEKVDSCKRKLDSSEATRLAAKKKYKGEVSALKIKEKAALDAASTSSKLVDDTTKEVIGTKARTILDMRKQITELLKEVKTGKAFQLKADRWKGEIDALVSEKNAWKDERKSLSTSNKSLKKLVNDQLEAKYKHQQRMAELALEVKQVALASAKHKQQLSADRNLTNLQAKKEFHTWNYNQRELQKEKELQRKEETKDKKAKKVADRLQIVSSDMLRTNRLNGGTFPSPGLRLEQVSCR